MAILFRGEAKVVLALEITMPDSSHSVLAAAAFYDSEHAHALEPAGVSKRDGRRIIQHYVDACLTIAGAEPRLLDGEGLNVAIADGMPRFFAAKDPVAKLIEPTLVAYLDFVHETEVVTHSFEQRLAFPSAMERCLAGIADGSMAGVGVRAAPTVRSRGSKVGRNDPCPCGSGKKFKKCCFGLSPEGAK